MQQSTAQHPTPGTAGARGLWQVFAFLLLAFLLPLVFLLLSTKTALGHSGIGALLLFGLQAATPALAAILVVLGFCGRRGLLQFLKQCYARGYSLFLLLFCLLLPALLAGAARLIYWLGFGVPPVLTALPAQKLLIIGWSLVAEELGWRGFLQQRLGNYLNRWLLPLVVGLVWAVWHYHLFLAGRTVAPLLPFVLGCVAESTLYFALTTRANGNIIPASVFHFSENLCLNLFLIGPAYNGGSNTLYLLYTACTVAAAAVATAVLWGGQGPHRGMKRAPSSTFSIEENLKNQ